MTDEATLFDLPNTPDEIGVILPPAQLRRIDFSALDFTTARRAAVEYIKTYFPDTFNDWTANSAVVLLTELVSAIDAKLALRGDMLGQDQFLATSITEQAVVEHLKLIGQRIKRQTPATVDVEVSITNVTTTDVNIQAGTLLQAGNNDVFYEVYRAPNDWTSSITIPAGKRGVIAHGLEGRFANVVSLVSAGGANQLYTLQDNLILEQPVVVTVGGEEWVTTVDALEKYRATDKVVEIGIVDTSMTLRFGDDVTGQAPLSGQTITVRYRTGGGVRGRIPAGQIDTIQALSADPPATAPLAVRFRNIVPSSGGTDRESLEQAKRRGPIDFTVQKSIVTDRDYAQVASSFSHPVYGSIAKAVASVRSGRNANLVEVYTLAIGADGRLAAPSAGLKRGLKTYYTELNVLTDTVEILDGSIYPINVEMTVVLNRNSDASVVKTQVNAKLDTFFSIDNWSMGQPFYISTLIDAIRSTDGVLYIDMKTPNGNIHPKLDENDTGIGFNQMVVEGTRDLKFYYERGN